MALPSLFQLLLIPFLFTFTIPLAILAGITTTIAFSVLMLRVAMIYVDLAIKIAPEYLLGSARSRKDRTDSIPAALYFRRELGQGRLPNRKRQRPSSGSGSGSGSRSPVVTRLSPVQSRDQLAMSAKQPRMSRRNSAANDIAAITSTIDSEHVKDSSEPWLRSGRRHVSMVDLALAAHNIDRDFEGVGGWKLYDTGDEDGPVAGVSIKNGTQRRYQWRSSCSGAPRAEVMAGQRVPVQAARSGHDVAHSRGTSDMESSLAAEG